MNRAADSLRECQRVLRESKVGPTDGKGVTEPGGGRDADGFNRLRLHVDTYGTSGSPIALLHGWGLHGGLFAPLLPSLTARHRVAVVDLPGHGYSPPLVPYTLDAIADAVIAALGEQAPVTLLGWSMGGLVAMRIAQRQPQRVARLVLVCTSPRFVAGDDWPHAMAAQTLARFGDELAIAYRLTLQRFLSLQVQGSQEGRRTLAALRDALFARGEPARDTLTAGLDLLARTDLRETVPTIAAPTLVLTGQRDALTPAAAGAWLARTLPLARYVDIAGAAHAPFLSHPAAFDAPLQAFLDAR